LNDNAMKPAHIDVACDFLATQLHQARVKASRFVRPRGPESKIILPT
jgi:hypothetical protein